MELTEEVKKIIDSMPNEEFLFCYDFSPIRNLKIRNEREQYIQKRFEKLQKH